MATRTIEGQLHVGQGSAIDVFALSGFDKRLRVAPKFIGEQIILWSLTRAPASYFRQLDQLLGICLDQ
ncbi:MAG: hypothetical protein EXS31_04025 [Pedosphaera sp.]|nr:hypothetical protein [Pedosphaera sp.]